MCDVPQSSQPPLLSVIIPTWKATDLLRECLESIAVQRTEDLEVLVVDNGNTPTSKSVVGSFPGVRYLPNPRNFGFAQAVNQGIASSTGQWVVALNDDATLASDFAEQLRPGLATGYDMVATKVVLAGTDMIDSAGVIVHSDGGSRERLRGIQEASAPANEKTEVFGPSGAAGVFSRTLLRATGGFDESFFAYYEDVDLAWRAQRLGYRCIYWPQARVFHRHSASWGRVSAGKVRYIERNRLWNLWKNYPLRYVIGEPVNRCLELAELRRSGYLGPDARQGFKELGVAGIMKLVMQADIEALTGLRSVLRKRRSVHRTGMRGCLDERQWLRGDLRGPFRPVG